jgi:hypothetical protein
VGLEAVLGGRGLRGRIKEMRGMSLSGHDRGILLNERHSEIRIPDIQDALKSGHLIFRTL